MRKILCFGDSNTFGYNPKDSSRFDKDTRWSGILQNLVGSDVCIIEAGANNRTAFCDNTAGVKFTGYKILPVYLEKNPDIDLVILAIGINDLQIAYEISLKDFPKKLAEMVDFIKEKTDAQVLIAAPSVITGNILKSHFSLMFDKSSIEKSLYLSDIYKKASEETASYFIDLNETAKVSVIDGLHYEPEEHRKIAQAMSEKVKDIFNKKAV